MRSRRLSRLVALCIAHLLPIQIVMASVGLGKSIFIARGPNGIAIDTYGLAGAPAGDYGRPNPFRVLVRLTASQSAGHIAFAGEAPAASLCADLLMAPVAGRIGDKKFVLQFSQTVGAYTRSEDSFHQVAPPRLSRQSCTSENAMRVPSKLTLVALLISAIPAVLAQ
jgi:hypothetical protein